MELKHMKAPCGPDKNYRGCPFRKDTEPGDFPRQNYECLRSTIGSDEDMKQLGDPVFACHKTGIGREVVCAGWLATHGRYHVAVRYAVVTGGLDPKMLEPQEGWPTLEDDYEDVVIKGYN